MSGPVALAFAAGMVGALNPCGFSLLPAYLGFFVSDDGGRSTYIRTLQAVRAAAAMTTGFVVVFILVGLVIDSLSSSLRAELPWIAVAIGVGLVIIGARVLLGGTLRLPASRMRLGGSSTRFLSIGGFGAAYAFASLSCALGPFLAVTAVSLRSSMAEGLLSYVAYALGMGLVIGVLGLAMAVAGPRPGAGMRGLSRYAPRAGGLLMILGGAYAIWFGRWELAVYDGRLETDPVVDAVEEIRISVVQFIETVGALRLGAIIVLAVSVLLWWMRLRPGREPRCSPGVSAVR